MRKNILMSACLFGENVRYDGSNCSLGCHVLEKLKIKYDLIPVCPEVLAGLPVPRAQCEIVGKGGQSVLNGTAKVLSKEGKDFTEDFIAGAKAALSVAKNHGAKVAILKNGSPSCGSTRIYDGSFTGNKIDQKGVAVVLLENSSVKVIDEEQIEKIDMFF